jgi:hypothetical protein
MRSPALRVDECRPASTNSYGEIIQAESSSLQKIGELLRNSLYVGYGLLKYS